jgi:hypothetical protein
MKTKIILITLFIFALSIISCDEYGKSDCPVDYRPSWISKDTIHFSDTSIYDDNMYISFSYPVGLERELHYAGGIIYRDSTITNGKFEINGNIKPFSEWNKCNIKIPVDTTKNWLFRFEGKNVPTNISFLYDYNNIGDNLVFWDSASNIKYNFEKKYKVK